MAKAKIPQKCVKDFYNYDFESVDTCPEDCWGDYTHANFCNKYFKPILRSELKKMAKEIGATVTLDGDWFDFSGFFCRNGKYVYFHIGDVRYNVCGHWYDNMYCRKAASDYDYSGGSNYNCSYEQLKDMADRLLED